MQSGISKWTVGLVMAVGVLSGCSNDDQPAPPEAHEQAVAFFHALYNERDMERVKELASEEHREVLAYYGVPSSIGRYLYNMNFDQVEVEADSSGMSLYRDRSDTARVQLNFTGTRHNQRHETLRDVVMVREGGDWRLDRVLNNPMQ
ncbi:hypothetical protein ACR0ST_05860 [Aliidiomarina sp. Khilg15.8]